MKTLQALGLEPPSGHLFHQTSVDFHTLEALQLQQRRLRMTFPEVLGVEDEGLKYGKIELSSWVWDIILISNQQK